MSRKHSALIVRAIAQAWNGINIKQNTFQTLGPTNPFSTIIRKRIVFMLFRQKEFPPVSTLTVEPHRLWFHINARPAAPAMAGWQRTPNLIDLVYLCGGETNH